ncbi:hypothetical protein [Eubacterium maltosivorans]|uniref:RNA polymerase sigma-70 region 4 domain-containing protein n=1 Tax=Eubacterium maltosivorans TaxID=2041044 RepID=A0A4P9C7E8_EUBML|nr:hypothetical protein [Eubacterium maltosivorans]QCT71377.1 hypothetical protein CPZ25_008550 [Eubacterium maltosivorans]
MAIIDEHSLKRMLRAFYSIKASAEQSASYSMLDTITDIENAIKQSKISAKQRQRLNYWMDGYTSKQIAELEHKGERVINQSLLTACQKIVIYLKGE